MALDHLVGVYGCSKLLSSNAVVGLDQNRIHLDGQTSQAPHPTMQVETKAHGNGSVFPLMKTHWFLGDFRRPMAEWHSVGRRTHQLGWVEGRTEKRGLRLG